MIFKIIAAIFLICIFSFKSFSQDNEIVYAFAKDGTPQPDFSKCDNFISVIKKTDTCYIARYYSFKGPMVKQESYRDSILTIPNGIFCWYNKKGKIDSSGLVHDSKKDGRWLTYGDTMQIISYDDYENGKFLKHGLPEKNDEADKKEKDTAQKEAKFVNADYSDNWSKYIVRNIPRPERLRPGLYPLTAAFLVNKQGGIENVYLLKSQEWQIDIATIHLIENSPKWVPAIQNGKPVYYLQKQKITYRVEEE